MDVLAAMAAIGGLVLVAGGAPKIRDPRPTTAALGALGIHLPDAAGRAMGAGEVVIGLAVLATGAPAIELLAASAYVAFAAFVAVAVRHGLPSCGCFGAAGRPPGWPHLLVDLALAVAAMAAAVTAAPSLPDLVGDAPAWLAVVASGAVACVAAMARRPGRAPRSTGAAALVADVDLAAGRTALVFLTTSCLTCREIWHALGDGAAPALPPGTRPVVVVKDDEPVAVVTGLAPAGVAVVRDSAAWSAYGVELAPAVVVVEAGAVVAADVVASWADLVAAASAFSRE